MTSSCRRLPNYFMYLYIPVFIVRIYKNRICESYILLLYLINGDMPVVSHRECLKPLSMIYR